MKQPDNNKQQQSAQPEQTASGGGPAAGEAAAVALPTSSWLSDNGAEPVARRVAAPALLFAVLAAFLFWGDTHILSQGGNLDARVYYPFVSSNELASLAIREPEDSRMPIGRNVYSFICQACHQVDGLGGVSQGCPPLAGSDWVLTEDPSRIIAIVLKGLSGPINVTGKEYGTGQMVALEYLSDEEIAGVLSVVRNNWSNKAPLVDPSQVKKIRAAVKDHPANMTVPELKTMFP